MADVIMPQMGESIAEGTVTKWLKNVGDRVERDEPLFEISTDKVDAEIPSPVAGVLKEIRVAPGTTVPVSTVVGIVAERGEASTGRGATPAPAPAPAEKPAAPAPTPPPAPSEATPPAPPQPAASSAPPADAPVAPPAPPAPSGAPARPPLAAVPAPSGPASEVPPVEYQIEDERPPAPVAAPRAPEEKPRADMTAEELRQVRSSPVVRKIAAEHQVDIREVPGTGIGGRVTKQDILGHLEGRGATPASPGPTAAPGAAAPAAPAASAPPAAAVPPPPSATRPSAPPAPPGPAARVQVVPLSPIRRKTAEHMVLSKRTSAHVSTVFEIDMTRVDQLRQKHRASFEERGVRLTYIPFVLKAVVDALKVHPVLNASMDGDSIVYHKDVNLAVAVALDWGLIVPVIHNADEKNLLGLARALADLAERARGKKLRVEEVQGGTFTVTNPGGFGSLFGTPIINQPQVAILDVGVIEKRPVVRDDAIAIRTMAYFALTFDHRLVDGADADRFMAHVKATLQEFDEAAL
jgi:pyruvate dehydrogenase E2 component (dihydrolipoamide acetyltransferase)